jgi:hypothetical protein
MGRLILIAALVLVSASAQAGDSRSLSTAVTTSDPPAATKTQPKSGALSAQTDSTATPVPAPPRAETPRYAPPAEAPKAEDATRNTDTPVQAPAEMPVRSEAPRYTARPAAFDTMPTAATAPSTRQHMPPREARYRRGRTHYAGAYGSDYGSDHGWGYGRPYFGPHRWSTWRIIATLHRCGIYW